MCPMKFVLVTFPMIHLSGRRDFELSAVDTLVLGGLLFLFLYSRFSSFLKFVGNTLHDMLIYARKTL